MSVAIWGVCGPSGSGETTLVRHLIASAADRLAVPPIDAYHDLDVSDDGCLERRTRRDDVERGRSPDDLARQYATTVRPMFERFVASDAVLCDRVVPFHHDRDVLVEELRALMCVGAGP